MYWLWSETWWEVGRRKQAWVSDIPEWNCCFPERGKLLLGRRKRCGWQMKSTRSSGTWGWQQQMNKCVTGCASHAVLGSAASQLCTKHVWKKRKISFIVGFDSSNWKKEKKSEGWVVSLPQGCVYDLSMNPSPVEPVWVTKRSGNGFCSIS